MSEQDPTRKLSKLDRMKLERDFQAFRHSKQEVNTEKRMHEVRAETETSIRSVAKELIALRDSFHKLRGETEAEDLPVADLRARVKSYQVLERQLEKALGEIGIQEILPNGEPLDLSLHHVEGTIASPETPADTIVRVIESGYSLNGKLIRPARVVVAESTEKGTKL